MLMLGARRGRYSDHWGSASLGVGFVGFQLRRWFMSPLTTMSTVVAACTFSTIRLRMCTLEQSKRKTPCLRRWPVSSGWRFDRSAFLRVSKCLHASAIHHYASFTSEV